MRMTRLVHDAYVVARLTTMLNNKETEASSVPYVELDLPTARS